MTPKNTSCLLLSSLLLCALIPSFIPFAQALNQRSLWGLIIGGSDGGSFSNDTQYMYHVLSEHYDFDGIYYLDVYTDRLGVNALSTKANVRSSITNWLASHSDENDIIFIHFSSHGVGYYSGLNHLLPYSMSGGRYDASMDEGDELQESVFLELCWVLHALYDIRGDNVPPWDWVRNFDTDPYIEIDLDSDGTIDIKLNNLMDLDGDGWNDDILLDPDIDDCCDIAIDADVNHDDTIDNFVSDGEDADNDGDIVGVDLNSDGDFNDWVGIDECMQVQDGLYWDDELASDLNTLSYAKLVFVRQGCVEGNQSCFGGGLIDDLSAPNRIIMCATNETWYSYGDMDAPGNPGYGYSEWSEAFIDALHGERTYYDATTHAIVHTGINVDADSDDNGYVSLWEAWEYAWNHDDACLLGWETPWFDDDGDGLPTFINGADHLDEDGQGDLAKQTFLVNRAPNAPSQPSGPTTVYRNVWYTYSTCATDPDGDSIRYHLNATGPGNPYENTTIWVDSGTPMIWNLLWEPTDSPGTYLIQTWVEDVHGALSPMSSLSVVMINSPPNTPSTPSGPSSGYTYTSYSYSTSTTDSDGDNMRYEFDWDDGSTTTGWYSSGQTASASHSWSSSRIYYVKVRAQDSYGAWSNCSLSLTVNISTGGGGYGCPMLFVWNGTDYAYECLLPIHNPEGIDVTANHTLVSTPQRVHWAYLFRLVEHPQTHSYIDQVKLYAVLENGMIIRLPLIYACHSEDGNVRPQLLFSDDWKTETLGADHNNGTSQSINLKFIALPPNLEIACFIFQIEGNNPEFKV